MVILIPTLNRVNYQYTLNALPQEWKEKTWLVVKKEEAPLHNYPRIMIRPDELRIPGIRQWAMENAPEDVIMMLDDDLRFAIRRGEDLYQPGNMYQACSDRRNRMQEWSAEETEAVAKLYIPTEIELCEMFEYVESCVSEGFALVGLSIRAINRFYPVPYYDNTRVDTAYAFDRRILQKAEVRFDRVPLMEAFDVTLSLLRKGYRNRVVFHWAQDNAKGSNAPGGCSTYRDFAMQEQAARALLELHQVPWRPGIGNQDKPYINVRKKSTKFSWKGKKGVPGGEAVALDMRERFDVHVRWQDVYADYLGQGMLEICDSVGIQRTKITQADYENVKEAYLKYHPELVADQLPSYSGLKRLVKYEV